MADVSMICPTCHKPVTVEAQGCTYFVCAICGSPNRFDAQCIIYSLTPEEFRALPDEDLVLLYTLAKAVGKTPCDGLGKGTGTLYRVHNTPGRVAVTNKTTNQTRIYPAPRKGT